MQRLRLRCDMGSVGLGFGFKNPTQSVFVMEDISVCNVVNNISNLGKIPSKYYSNFLNGRY